ncbi:helix-turn-helix domain-containing protein [Microbispora hainanensis]|uniref:Helix-turn-helix domain-containing protein n=1 Tax=Microbispora hainanensis TaxID=568844 RepID=A0ABZ1SM55_9ACTN|nr:helix-turn-helix domain-containing protein [Microbispora hainanensis]
MLGFSIYAMAERMGVSQARVSQIEHGQIGGLDTLRSYVVALGGRLDVVADFGDHSVKVA